MSDLHLPVVIVGKDRTRMTCEVVRHLNEKLMNCEPHFIVVSDRSRFGHCEAIRGFFREELSGVDFQILETSSDRFGWGAAMNIGLEEAFKIAPYAMVLDNDWILNRPIPDLGKLCGILSSGEGDIGAITLKCPNGGRNLDYWKADYEGVNFLFSREKKVAPFSYPVEIGCQLISRRFHEKMQFLKNENKTDQVEWDWISKFRKLTGEGFALKQVNLASEEGTELNKPGCLFYHIGKHTQSGRDVGMKVWPVPKEYEYLNEENETDKKKMKILFATNGDFSDATSPLRASFDILKDVAGGDLYVVGKSLFGKEAFLNIFEHAIKNGYSHIIYSDADNFIVSKKNLMTVFDRFVKAGRTFAGCPDGGMFCHRNHNPNAINPFLMFVSVDGLRKYIKDGKPVFKGDRSHRETGWVYVIEDYGKWREKTGVTNQFAKKIAGILDNPDEVHNYGSLQVCWTYKEGGARFEPYYDIFLNLEDGDEIFYLNGGDWVGRGDESGLTSAIYCFEGEHDYSDERNVICLHSWFSRFCFEPKSEFEKSHRERIAKLAQTAIDWYGLNIDWKKYIDHIYCIHYSGFKNREDWLNEQLSYVGIRRSGIFELVSTNRGEEEKELYERCKNHNLPSIGYASQLIGLKHILENAIKADYDRIMILEDDISFLKSFSKIRKILDSIPEGFDIFQLSHIPGIKVGLENLLSNRVNSEFYNAGGLSETDASCFILTKTGMRKLYDRICRKPAGVDQCLEACDCNIARSIVPLTIQRIYDNSTNKSLDANCEKYIAAMYGKIKLDKNDYYMPCETIDWDKYVDAIYCLHYQPQEVKLKRLMDELARVDILGFDGFHLEYNFPSKYDQYIFNAEKDEVFCPSAVYVNVCLSFIRILKTAIARGEKRILFLENDIAFLRDKSRIGNILDSIPRDADFVQFDKYVAPGKQKDDWDSISSGTDDLFIKMGDCNFTSAACLWLNENAMNEMLRNLENRICATDQIYRLLKCSKYISRINLCVQALYEDSNSFNSIGQGSMDTVYLTQGISYKDYNVPDGYDYGKTVEDCMKKNVIGDNCKGLKKVSVYAIAYNESRNIDKWYSCVSEADEVVVLDTGSTDDTVEKLRKLGAYVEVEKFDKWNSVEEYDDIVKHGGNPWRFDKARNDSMKLVAEDSDILVTIDIDEFIRPGWRKKLEDQWIAAEKSGKHPTCAAYKYVWCYNPDGTEARSFEIHKIHARGVCHWTHMIHEVLHYDSGELPFWLKDFVVEHHQDMSKTRKSYLPMLAVEARDMPENDRSAHYYGRELMYAERWDEAIKELKRHLTLSASGWRAERAASMRYIACCYSAKGDFDMEELWLWKAAMEDPNHREASFRLGEIYMNRKDWRSAERAWEFCLNIKNRSQEYISDNRCWSAEPYLKYAQALWWNGNWRAACELAEMAVKIEPSNREAIAQRDGMQATRKKFNR